MPDRWLYDSPHIRHSVQTILCVSGDAGRAVVLRIEPPVASRPFGLSSLTPSPRRCCALRLPPGDRLAVHPRRAGLGAPFDTAEPARRIGREAVSPMTGLCG